MTLLIIDHREGAAGAARAFVVGGTGCSLGRDLDNDLVLADPERLVSGRHARIELRDGNAWLMDHSTNGTFVNDSADRLPRGVSQPLQDGDVLTVGPYEIQISMASAPDNGAPPAVAPAVEDPFAPPGAAPPKATPTDSSPLDGGASTPLPGLEQHGPAPDILDLIDNAGSGEVSRAGDPFASAQQLDSRLDRPVLDDGQAQMQPNPPTPAEHAFFRAPKLEAETARFEPGEPQPDFGPSAGPAGRGSEAAGEIAPEGEAGRDGSAALVRNDKPFGDGGVPEADHAESPAPAIPENYDLLLDASVIEPRKVAPTAPAAGDADEAGHAAPPGEQDADTGAREPDAADADDVRRRTGINEPVARTSAASDAQADGDAGGRDRVESHVVLPQPGGRRRRRPAAAEAGAPSGSARAPTTTESDSPVHAEGAVGYGSEASDLLRAFADGLGVGDPQAVDRPEQFLHDAGALLRALVGGLANTLLARTVFKSEMRLGMTTIRAAENNPYKFSPGADDALERLLLRPNPAFKPALIATEEAFDDLKAHEMAMIAGLRSALRELLAKLDPDALAGRLEGERKLEKLLPMARRARCWEAYTRAYREVAADAAEDPMGAFGEEFTRAYEEQIRALSEARRRGSQ